MLFIVRKGCVLYKSILVHVSSLTALHWCFSMSLIAGIGENNRNPPYNELCAATMAVAYSSAGHSKTLRAVVSTGIIVSIQIPIQCFLRCFSKLYTALNLQLKKKKKKKKKKKTPDWIFDMG